MTDEKKRPRRQNIYFPDRMMDNLSNEESLSGRVVEILDRYFEALRRTKPHIKFTADEQLVIRQACQGWWAQPAATIFGGIGMELEDNGAPDDLVAKINALTPFDQVALLEWVKSER